jgi:hypothetical protein
VISPTQRPLTIQNTQKRQALILTAGFLFVVDKIVLFPVLLFQFFCNIIPPEIQIHILPYATDTKQSDLAAKCATLMDTINLSALLPSGASQTITIIHMGEPKTEKHYNKQTS